MSDERRKKRSEVAENPGPVKKKKVLSHKLCVDLLRDMLEGRREWEDGSLWSDDGHVSFKIGEHYRFEIVTEEGRIEYTHSVIEMDSKGNIIASLFENDFDDDNDPIFVLEDEEVQLLEKTLRNE